MFGFWCYQVVKWFWEVLEEFETDQKARLLQFVTGTSGVPAQVSQYYTLCTIPSRLSYMHASSLAFEFPVLVADFRRSCCCLRLLTDARLTD